MLATESFGLETLLKHGCCVGSVPSLECWITQPPSAFLENKQKKISDKAYMEDTLF